MAANKPPIRVRLANAILGSRVKGFISPLSPLDGWTLDGTGRLNQYTNATEQLKANMGWIFTANTAIVDPCSAVPLKLFKKATKGQEREEVDDHELLDLLSNPNAVHTGEQLRQLHHTYMNLVGESYILMTDLMGNPFAPAKGKLPAAFHILPAHQVSFELGSSYSSSWVKYNNIKYPLPSVIRDINPDPVNPYLGRSTIAAAAATIDTENQMKEWNRRFFANNARPSLIFSTNEQLDNDAYERWKAQFSDDHTGTENAFKPLLIEGGDAKPYMLSQSDLDFLESRKFSRDEILAMFRVNPGIIGSVENVNKATITAAFYLHAVINIEPRVRQFVRQLNASLVQLYDSTLELDYENPVPEDVEAKLQAAKEGTNVWWTIDEARAMYGDDPLPDGLGEHIIIPGKTPMTLEDVVNGEPAAGADDEDPLDPDDDGDDPTGDHDDDSKKALAGVKKNS
jgi:HK97 family phage portal protein